MKKIIILTLSLGFFLLSYSQKDSVYLKKNRLPYNKYRGLQLAYIGLSPSIHLSLPKGDYALDIGISPTLAYYFNKKMEVVARYSFSYVKYGSLSAVNAEGFNEFLLAAHYYPFKNINFLYAEVGFLYGNYYSQKITRYLVKDWNWASTVGFGIEVLTKKKIVVNFDVAYIIPFNTNYNFNLYRSIGIGFQLDKKKK